MLAAARAVGAAGVERFAHGTTVATNALLERRGARTAFVGNAGFEHLLHLRRQTRAHLYRLCEPQPEPLVPLERCHGVEGRLGPDGELVPLDLATLPDIGDAEAVAVCLLFAFRDPRHEVAVAEELRARHPGVHVVASHEVAPEFREYERASTTAADAYLAPISARYLRALAGAAQEGGLPEPLVMLSSGGVATVDEAAAHPATILVSGPAAGVVGAGLVARRAGLRARDRVRHGRDVDRRVPASGRPRGPRRRARRRRPADPRSDASTCTRSARAAARSSASTPAARSASGPRAPARIPGLRATARAAGRPSPTRTCCSGGCRRSFRAGSCSTATRRSARFARHRPAGGDRRRQRGDAARAARRLGRARPRSARLRARRVRRRGAAARVRARGGARDRGGARPRGGRRALGARARRERRAARPRRRRTSARSPRPASCRRKARPTCATAASRSSCSVPLAAGARAGVPSRARGAVRLRRRVARDRARRAAHRGRHRRGPTSPSLQQTVTRSRGHGSSELPGATCWVPDGWHGETNDDGTLVLRR